MELKAHQIGIDVGYRDDGCNSPALPWSGYEIANLLVLHDVPVGAALTVANEMTDGVNGIANP